MHTTLLSAFLVLLLRYSSQEDIVLGIPAAGRMLPETEPMIGLFVNTMAARHDLSGDPSVNELLRRVSRTTLDDLSNQDYPFELVVQALNPSRDMRTTPLFQVMFNYENVPQQAVSIESLRLESIDYDPGLAQFDLTLEIDDRGDRLACAFSFNQDIFERATIERMTGHYRTLLEGFVSDPLARISDLTLLTQAEMPRLSFGRDKPVKLPTENLHSWFEAQVQQTPHAAAIEFEGETLTYKTLNKQANRLAHTLLDLGVNPNQLVGLCVEPSLNLVVGILGILKAGGAYVPLDPSYPRERLQFMLGDANIDLVVSEEPFLPLITRSGLSTLALDSEADRIAVMSDDNPAAEVGRQDLAYVLYTSGSTGEPKGAEITHGNVIQLFQATEDRYCFGSEDIWSLFHSFTFDFSVWELFGALLYGGRLVVIPVSMRRALDTFFEQVVFERLTILAMIPPLLFEAARMPAFFDRLGGSKLRHIFLGGDELEAAKLAPFFQGDSADRIQISNVYGPTEATVFATWHEVGPPDLDQTLGSIIGRPLEGVNIFILDPNLNLLPVGVQGEIVIGGPGVARGYLNRPALDRERFITHPLDPRPGSRFYRTGDVGRIRTDGELEFLGRQDAQIKIRGFRVEPGEIEAVLQSHVAVSEAVVQLVETDARDEILAAYVVLEGDQSLQFPEMRAFLSGILPDYMIPSAMMEIESVPLTSIGKLDRKALPDLGPRERSLPTTPVEPETGLQKRLQALWMRVLQVSEVGLHDNFFNLGGHSLLAMQLVARVREQLSVELNVQDVFGKGQTIAGMAEVIELRSWLTSAANAKGVEGGQDQEQGRI
jgi:amino acid adenylation domain-containing protein